MSLSAHSTARRDNISRQSGELSTQTFNFPTFADAMNPVLLAGRVPAQYALFESIRHQRYRQALLLVEAGVHIDSRNDKGETPLIYTSLQVDDPRIRARFAQLFIKAGADPNTQDWKGFTALMHSSSLGQTDIVLQLVEHPKIDPNIQDQEGNTALMYAARNGHTEVVAIILNAFRRLDKTLDIEHKNIEGMTALDLATSNGHSACIQILVLASEQPDQLVDVVIPNLALFDHGDSGNRPSSVQGASGDDTETNIPSRASSKAGQNLAVTSSGATMIDVKPVVIVNGPGELPAISNAPKVSTPIQNGLNSRHVNGDGDLPSQESGATKVKRSRPTTPKASILPLLSLSNIDTSSSEPWEWDLGATGRRVKHSKNRMDTGSRSLTESRGRLTDAMESIKEKGYSNSMDYLSASFSGASLKERMGSSTKHHSSSDINILPPLMPNKEGLHLPPIRANLADYKRALRTPPKDGTAPE